MNGSLAGNCHNTHPAVGLHFLEFHPNENKKIVSAGDRLARVTNKKGKKTNRSHHFLTFHWKLASRVNDTYLLIEL